MVMSTKTAPALLGRRRRSTDEMVKLFILEAFEMGGGRGIAKPGSIQEFTPERALHLMHMRRARMATAQDAPKTRRRKAEAETDAEPAAD